MKLGQVCMKTPPRQQQPKHSGEKFQSKPGFSIKTKLQTPFKKPELPYSVIILQIQDYTKLQISSKIRSFYQIQTNKNISLEILPQCVRRSLPLATTKMKHLFRPFVDVVVLLEDFTALLASGPTNNDGPVTLPEFRFRSSNRN